MVNKLNGRVAVVTGAASGIGLAFARRLAADGASILIADLSSAESTADALERDGFHARGVACDVSSETDVANAVGTAVQVFGGVDILVNNAALFSALTPCAFTDIDAAAWQRVMNVNTLGPFLAVKAAVPHMRQRGGGRIINIASNTVHKGAPGLLHYVSSKGAVIAMTRALARELGKDAITVNALAPGFTLSDGVNANDAYQATFKAAALDTRSIRRDQLPADLVGAVSFLASDDAAFLTGQTLIVDGGNMFS